MSQFQILGRRPFTFEAVSIRFACTNFSGSIPPVRLRRASSAVQTETQKLHLLAISAHEAAQHAVNGVAPEVGRHDRGQPLDQKTHVLGPLGYVYGIGRGERIRGEAVARRLRPTGRPELFPAKRPSSSSQKTASRLHGLDSLTLLSEHRSPTATPDARQRSMGPAHMSRLAASPLTDATSLQDKRRLR